MLRPQPVWILALALASAPLNAQGSSQCATGILADSVEPSREGFFREVLYAAGSARTPRFDDYTPGSYHADKLDIAEGLPLAAKRCGAVLEGVVVVGPLGPLWSYHVIAFLKEDSGVRLNTLVMPHARITGKATATISPGDVADFFRALSSSPALKPGRPVWSDTTMAGLARDFSYDFLAIRFGSDSAVWFGSLERHQDSAAVAAVFNALNRLLTQAKSTYGRSN